jgi:glutamate dehydrogenase
MYSAPASDPLPEGFAADDSYPDKPIGLADFGDRLALLHRGETDLFFRHREDELELVTLTAMSPPPTLGEILPMLQCLDLEIVDRRSRALIRDDGLQCHVVVLGLVSVQRRGGAASQAWQARMDDALRAMWRGDADVDDFNKLVAHAGMSWRDTAALRAYARYLRQLGQPFSARFAAVTLLENTAVASALVALFQTHVFGAAAPASPPTDSDDVRRSIVEAIQQVPQLDADRLLRALLAVISATVRTNFGDSMVPSATRALALKIAPQQIPFAPLPRPLFEIYVLSPALEGVHLRFGHVARGGLRWSDRTEDLRTEILGLASTQQAKNAVIVPVGAKGGYVLRRAPKDDVTRAVAGKRGYELFVSALLDVTDNVDQLRHNPLQPGDQAAEAGPDPYLVVAADKGTATFADSANAIAAARRYWLGDAFASGGRVGYDHKKMGITARGAWISAQRHLGEIGIDPAQVSFTTVGIGDMSGDVFGNGMLLSSRVRLIAAFDHRDIFIDPDPDPVRSFAERQRLFDKASSRWSSYDTDRLSRGGGVWPRSAKSIVLSGEACAALGLPQPGSALTPDELIQAILRAPVDMIWNGGVGTYVKASPETHLSVGDKSNDAVRINANELRARVIVEGGNLGLTQAARIEFARAGGRVNTDALDNSAGVDCSDHEVNIKIALSLLCASGHLKTTERDALLHALEPDVAELVLANNFDHNAALGVSRRNAAALNDVHARQVAALHGLGDLDRHMAGLPSADEFSAMTRRGHGLLSPDLAILMAHTKLSMKRELLAESALDGDEFREYFINYFPKRLRPAIRAHGEAHPLRRDIAATALVNHIVAVAGPSFVHRLREQTGATTLDAVRAFRITVELFGIDKIKRLLDASDLEVGVTDEVRLRIRLLVDRCAAVLINRRRLNPGAEVRRLHPTLKRIGGFLRHQNSHGDLHTAGSICALSARAGTAVGDELREWLRLARLGPELLDAADIAATADRSATDIATAFFGIHDRLRISELGDAVNRIKMTGSQSHFLARLALASEVAAIPRMVTESLLEADTSLDIAQLRAFTAAHQARLADIDETIAAVVGSTEPDIETLLVLLHRMKGLASAAA